ncbi:MAG TPA: GreA/GreB family elongation factor [Candidatus Baltobacteraceae bacterium]|nr:GreA/GreB family elongation factor [Candidatus Baltobacteraceae bacterium]
MSRAFVKDDSDAPEPRFERPVSVLPNYVTPGGLALLRSALVRAQAAGNDREMRYVQERIDSAIVIDPSAHPQGVVEFGASVRAHDADGHELRVRIVGEDEADPPRGAISWESPIARALTDHRAGDTVLVRRPAGPIEYTIDQVEYE